MRYNLCCLAAVLFLSSSCGHSLVDESWPALSYVNTVSGSMPIMTDIQPEEVCAVKAVEKAFQDLKQNDAQYGFLRQDIKGGYLFIRNSDQIIPRICEPWSAEHPKTQCVNTWKDVPKIWDVAERVPGEGYSGMYAHYVFVSRIGIRAPFYVLLNLVSHERGHEVSQWKDGRDLNVLTNVANEQAKKIIQSYVIPECASYVELIR